MNFLRKHWYDLGGFLSVAVLIYVYLNYSRLTNYQTLMWFSLISLILHQLEEYRIVGTFPGMVNKVMYKSQWPDRYPLNTNTALYVNVFIGWGFYFLAAVFAEKAIWMGIATILVSIGNAIVHAIVFNLKGKTFYNAGMLTACLLFLPCACYFFFTIHTMNLVATMDYAIGIPLGIVVNFVGIVKLIDWMADKDTAYIFDNRNLLPEDREMNHC